MLKRKRYRNALILNALIYFVPSPSPKTKHVIIAARSKNNMQRDLNNEFFPSFVDDFSLTSIFWVF